MPVFGVAVYGLKPTGTSSQQEWVFELTVSDEYQKELDIYAAVCKRVNIQSVQGVLCFELSSNMLSKIKQPLYIVAVAGAENNMPTVDLSFDISSSSVITACNAAEDRTTLESVKKAIALKVPLKELRIFEQSARSFTKPEFERIPLS